MKFANVVVVGLVVLGTFGLVFAYHTCYRYLLPQFGCVLYVGQSCVTQSYKVKDECYLAASSCAGRVPCGGNEHAKCARPTADKESGGMEFGYMTIEVYQFNCPLITNFRRKCLPDPLEPRKCVPQGAVDYFYCPNSAPFKSPAVC